jgi:hypothetical protein
MGMRDLRGWKWMLRRGVESGESFDRRMVVELPTDGYYKKSGVGGAERAELEATREPLEGHF